MSHTYEIFLCGRPLGWDDDSYPEDSDETLFYVDPGGEAWGSLIVAGVGVQDGGALFSINFGLKPRLGANSVLVSRSVPGDPSRNWTLGTELLELASIEFDDGRFRTVDRGVGLFNPEDPTNLVRVDFEATCESYGGSFDTAKALGSEVTGIPLPPPGEGSFISNDELFAFDPETCGIAQQEGLAEIKFKGERFTLEVRVDGEGGPQFVSLSISEPDGFFRLDAMWEAPLVVEGNRLYAPEPFLPTNRYTQEAVPFSLDVTCPDTGG